MKYSFLFIFICFFSVLRGQTTLKDYIKTNANIFQRDTLDTNTLEILKMSLKNVEIIGLGEQTHFDGVTSIARVALVKYLHQKCDFNVIAFESGFYDCYRAYELAKISKNKDSILIEPIFGIFRVQEIKPLFEYIAKTYTTANPLKLVGFDHQFSSVISKKYFLNDFISFIDKEKIFDTHSEDYDKYFLKMDRIRTKGIFKQLWEVKENLPIDLKTLSTTPAVIQRNISKNLWSFLSFNLDWQ